MNKRLLRRLWGDCWAIAFMEGVRNEKDWATIDVENPAPAQCEASFEAWIKKHVELHHLADG
jgi:hypothetical protein